VWASAGFIFNGITIVALTAKMLISIQNNMADNNIGLLIHCCKCKTPLLLIYFISDKKSDDIEYALQ